jgi:hypothetical protein
MAAVLENSSLLEDTVTLSGLIVLQRRPETVTLQGERVTIPSEETILVECDADEALGMSLSSANSSIPLLIESSVWDQGCTMAERINKGLREGDVLDMWRTVDHGLLVLIEGQARNQAATERILPVRLPRGEPSLYDRLLSQQQLSTQDDVAKDMFPTDNPITSLRQLDEMSNGEKAGTLMRLSNFFGRLPRPRVLRSSNAAALDNLLLPLIDESVRNQYLIRDAQQRGDVERVQELKASKSRRLEVREKAEEARKAGADALAEQWEDEDEFLKTLRADFTQDEGSYSCFLDRDEWYERDRQRLAERVKKSMLP